MFREKLKNDLNGISPDEELLIKVTKMMQEEAQKPREPKRVAFMHLGGMAAAVCMIAVGSIAMLNMDSGVEVSPETAAIESEDLNETMSAETGVPEIYAEEAALGAVNETAAGQATTEAAAEAECYVLTEEVSGAVEAESVGEIITADIYFKGDSVALTEETTLEIAAIAEKYMNENSYRALDLMLTEDETERIGGNGLYFKASYMDGSYTAVYINDENSYACKGFLTYDLFGEEKALILSYFE